MINKIFPVTPSRFGDSCSPLSPKLEVQEPTLRQLSFRIKILEFVLAVAYKTYTYVCYWKCRSTGTY